MPETDLSDFNNYKVKLVSIASLRFAEPYQIERVVFDVTPTFSESRSVEYTSIAPIHMPGSVQVYKNTNARQFSLTAHLVSRNSEDATNNMVSLQLLRSWTMPYFGEKSSTLNNRESSNRQKEAILRRTGQPSPTLNQESGTTDAEQQAQLAIQRVKYGIELIGAPPDVLYLYAYSKPTSRGEGMVNINRVPVVLASLDIAYPEDVDYIPTNFGNKDPMPTRMDVSLSLLETHSPVEYEQFSLAEYKSGTLRHF